MLQTTWKLTTASYDKKNQNWLQEMLAKHRGLTTKKKLDEFLNPKIEEILKIRLTDIEKGTERVIRAIKNKEKMVVYSDYDADGINASAIMWETLYDIGADIMPYVPHRIKEGYGLAIGAIEELAKQGVKLIITVDHGVTATTQVEAAKKLGVDVVITDHHVLPKNLPKPYALVHTTDVCGAGVSWRFCWEIISKFKPAYKEDLVKKLELAAIATIADLVPLIGASRAIVKIGLEKLQKTNRPGLLCLMRNSNVTTVGTYEIGHILAPRINAMGRIEHGMDALRLICAKNMKQAQSLAHLLSKTNSKRQDLTTDAVGSAIKMVDEQQVIGVLSHESWHEGVIGLVASRLVEVHHRPMVVISKGEIHSKGSARSIPGFNIIEAIRESAEFLIDAGGHPMAAGFTIETRYIEAFSKKINVYAQSQITQELLTPYINIECKLETTDINMETLKIVKTFEPFGMGNPEPIFETVNMTVEDLRGVGADNRHLKLQVDGLNAIAFNKGEYRPKIRPGYRVDLVYTIAPDNYNGHGAIQLKVKDLLVKASHLNRD